MSSLPRKSWPEEHPFAFLVIVALFFAMAIFAVKYFRAEHGSTTVILPDPTVVARIAELGQECNRVDDPFANDAQVRAALDACEAIDSIAGGP